MPRRSFPRNWNDPRSWPEVSLALRNLQDKVDSYKGRFEAPERQDISKKLEECIHLVMDAEQVAMTL